MGQEGDVHTVHTELLLPEPRARILLIELCQGLLQLRGPGERRGRAGAGGQSPDRARSHPREEQSLPMAREGAPHLLSLRWGWAGAPKELSPQQVPIILQKGQVEVSEGSCVLILHTQLLW